MARTEQRQFTPEFRAEAVRLAQVGDRSIGQVAVDLLSKVAALVVLAGCGARTGLLVDDDGVAGSDSGMVTEGDDDNGGQPSADGSSSDSSVAFQDAGSVGPRVACSLGTSGVQGGGGSCEVHSTESCSDGKTYDVACSCPAATCACSESSGQSGSSGGGIPFSGCTANCAPSSIDLAYESCGFPH
jgi:hypothetical protein